MRAATIRVDLRLDFIDLTWPGTARRESSKYMRPTVCELATQLRCAHETCLITDSTCGSMSIVAYLLAGVVAPSMLARVAEEGGFVARAGRGRWACTYSKIVQLPTRLTPLSQDVKSNKTERKSSLGRHRGPVESPSRSLPLVVS